LNAEIERLTLLINKKETSLPTLVLNSRSSEDLKSEKMPQISEEKS